MKTEKTGIVFSMAIVILVFLVIAFFLFAERLGIVVRNTEKENHFLEDDKLVLKEDALLQVEKKCLVITDLGRDDCIDAYDDCFATMLLDMKVACEVIDIGYMSIPADLSAYDTLFLATPDISAISERLLEIIEWVENGGRMMIAMCVEPDSYSTYLLQKTGVFHIDNYSMLSSIFFDENFAIGGGKEYGVSDPFDSSLTVVLRETADVFAWNGSKSGTPVIWSCDYGTGRFVVCNLGIYEKSNRGVYSMAYSLLEDVCVYPVLNGAIVFLDDMPSPVPEGDSEYIDRDFNTSIADYYVNYWFPDIQNMAHKYSLHLVGLCIENYGKDVSGTTERQRDTARFSYFGNQLLRDGGEIGLHGYNHQPLCLSDVDYKDLYDYHTWNSIDSIDSSFKELIEFTKNLYPDADLTCYVPPSNIMSDDGRKYIGSLYPEIKTISGSYFPELGFDDIYDTEFEVCEDCIVNLPRVTSGSLIDDYMRMAAFSEMNFHFVFSHFIHPDDALDVDRGAELGWRQLYSNLDGFLGDIIDSAPIIRRTDSATLAGTVQRWSALTVDKEYEYSENETILKISLGNFYDEAYLFVRFNNGMPDSVSGADIEKLTETLYLLTARSSEIDMYWER